ncbi:MAG: F0F1 ATP synthase subunit gamma [Proteobacteria bacterium]|nr:F0F1 ATP synthase subunit gamma [Pseudomonadota bacterium]
MANLKELKTRISSVTSTQKITSAMKMVAASRLRRAQEAAEAGRPYAERMERMMGAILDGASETVGGPKLLSGTGSDQVHMIVAVTSDRGLCGGFNSSITREVRLRIAALEREGKTVKLLCVGRKARDQLRSLHGDKMLDTFEGIGRTVVTLEDAQRVTAKVLELLDAEEFDVCTIVYNRFVSAMTQIVTPQQIIPVTLDRAESDEAEDGAHAQTSGPSAVYEYEPDEAEILEALLPKNLEVQIFRALLESNASEHGARMSAMDNATRNAGDMIDDLTLTYNRTRQALITRELIEIISGAEAL